MKFFSWSKSSSIPEVGRDIRWVEIIRHVFRIIEFDRTETRVDQNNNVIAKSKFKPYGYLIVDSPFLQKNVRLPIVHKDDFLLAVSVFDYPKLSKDIKEMELLVTYIPKQNNPRGLAGIWHALHFTITITGTIEKFYKNESEFTNPTPEKIFKNISWIGEIEVQINLNPNV